MNLFNLYEICSDIKYLLWKVSDFDIFDYSLMMQNLVGFPFSFSCFRHESRWFFSLQKLVLSHRHLLTIYIFLKISKLFPYVISIRRCIFFSIMKKIYTARCLCSNYSGMGELGKWPKQPSTLFTSKYSWITGLLIYYCQR